MKFHINYTPQKADFSISHKHKLMLSGSCFAENIGNLLIEHKFDTLSNASGILFNPLSIYHSLNACIDRTELNPDYILERSGEYFSFLHHSSVKEASDKKLLDKINQIDNQSLEFLKKCDYLLITFGSAYYYRHVSFGICVANCHKQPGGHFEKKLLTVDQIVNDYEKLILKLSEINPRLKIIFTVSPVKYLRDGLIENNVSKSTLLLSVYQLVQKHKNCFYFPSYELVTDDLRDYRFYKEDLSHPNDMAIKYIWEKFSETYFSDKTKQLNEKYDKLNIALRHKPLHNNPDELKKFKAFVEGLEEEIARIQKE